MVWEERAGANWISASGDQNHFLQLVEVQKDNTIWRFGSPALSLDDETDTMSKS